MWRFSFRIIHRLINLFLLSLYTKPHCGYFKYMSDTFAKGFVQTTTIFIYCIIILNVIFHCKIHMTILVNVTYNWRCHYLSWFWSIVRGWLLNLFLNAILKYSRIETDWLVDLFFFWNFEHYVWNLLLNFKRLVFYKNWSFWTWNRD